MLRYTEYRRIGRLIGTLALPAAVAAGLLVGGSSLCDEETCVIVIPALAVGGGAGSIVGGYYIGKRVDKRVTEIRIAREE